MASKRTRVYATVVYPESAPDNWVEIIKESHVSGFISPLHDQDVDNSTGEIKKPHYHVLFQYDGVKSKDQFDEFKRTFSGVGTEYVQSFRGYARYLCHLDNPEKHQYSVDHVIELGGSDYLSTIARTSDRYSVIREMIIYVKNTGASYADLLEYAADNNINWFVALCDSSSYVIGQYIKDFHKNGHDLLSGR